jgi:murein DD-endopeptidase MepM/ murein hydrolase activator NlpD
VTHQIDASFRQRKQSFSAWRRRRRLRRLGIGTGIAVVLALTAGAYYFSDLFTPEDDLDEELQATDLSDLPEDAPAYVPAIVDLAGDPLWITLDRDPTAKSKVTVIDRPDDVDGTLPEKLEILTDEMLSSSERFMTTIPSSQEDFAFFQAQRGGAAPAAEGSVAEPDGDPLDATEEAPSDPAVAPGETVDDVGAGWDDLPEVDEAAPTQFKKTEIENTTTVATVIPEANRFEPTEDTFVRILNIRTLESVVLEAGFDPADAKRAAEALAAIFKRTQLDDGFVVAMRGYRADRSVSTASLMQVSIYAKDTYVGTLVRNDAGALEAGVDPWVANDLFNYSGLAAVTGERQYRLLDAIYSTGVRNNVPPSVVGEAIVHLSRANDLNLFAAKSDRLTLIYSQEPRASGDSAGRVLYVAVQGPDRNLECYVFKQADGSFSCTGEVASSGTAVASTGMTNPVNGVLTSTFGPRKHPILKVVRLHKGVDWKAPTGTPIVAAFDGEIAYRGDGKGYGNIVRMSHPGNRETRYAHMQRFADGIKVGMQVKAGTVIGFVGTTGLSTGPHLHFEVYLNGQPIDPLSPAASEVVTALPAPAAPAAPAPATPPAAIVTVALNADEAAIEILTNRIVHVESGGSATAKNPRSSATGLGQFISTTWLRMMRTYRPDLARSMSERELLALRFDPTISREMVKNLAREGEAYLKQRGHAITAGRLYLCHFLGMEGAHIVLAASGEAALVSLLGAPVIKANPFLSGKNAAYVIDWAERKMRGKKGAPPPPSSPSSPSSPPPVVVAVSPEFEKYKLAVAAILKAVAPAG